MKKRYLFTFILLFLPIFVHATSTYGTYENGYLMTFTPCNQIKLNNSQTSVNYFNATYFCGLNTSTSFATFTGYSIPKELVNKYITLHGLVRVSSNVFTDMQIYVGDSNVIRCNVKQFNEVYYNSNSSVLLNGSIYEYSCSGTFIKSDYSIRIYTSEIVGEQWYNLIEKK